MVADLALPVHGQPPAHWSHMGESRTDHWKKHQLRLVQSADHKIGANKRLCFAVTILGWFHNPTDETRRRAKHFSFKVSLNL